MTEVQLALDRTSDLLDVFGSFDANLRAIESELEVRVHNRDSMLHITGEPENVMYAQKAIESVISLVAKGEHVNAQDAKYIAGLAKTGSADGIEEFLRGDVVCVTAKGRPLKAKTLGQRKYVEAIAQNTVTIAVGPAGTGKTYLAVACAVAA